MLQIADLQAAYSGSFYTIRGAGGDLAEWTTGYEGLLAEHGIEKPTEWFQIAGAAVNSFAGPDNRDPFPADLTLLMFPLDGLDLSKLAIFRIQQMDAWFDDIIDNMRR